MWKNFIFEIKNIIYMKFSIHIFHVWNFHMEKFHIWNLKFHIYMKLSIHIFHVWNLHMWKYFIYEIFKYRWNLKLHIWKFQMWNCHFIFEFIYEMTFYIWNLMWNFDKGRRLDLYSHHVAPCTYGFEQHVGYLSDGNLCRYFTFVNVVACTLCIIILNARAYQI